MRSGARKLDYVYPGVVTFVEVASSVDLDAVAEVEGKINSLRDQLREKHLKDVERGKYPASSGVLYNELITSLEECGDRIAHVSSQLAEGARQAQDG